MQYFDYTNNVLILLIYVLAKSNCKTAVIVTITHTDASL